MAEENKEENKGECCGSKCCGGRKWFCGVLTALLIGGAGFGLYSAGKCAGKASQMPTQTAPIK